MLAASVVFSICLAQDYSMDWHTIDAGGGTSAAGAFVLSGTIGQHDASALSTGGPYELAGGLWFAASAATPTCPGDLDGDGQVGLSDLLIILSDFGCTGGCPGDADGDGNTGLIDLLLVLSNFGVPCN